MKIRSPRDKSNGSSPASDRAAAGLSSRGERSPVSGSPHQLHQEQRIAQLNALAQAPASNGLPEQLTRSVAALSGEDLSDVRVHRSSARPAQLSAAAYAQGRDIHLAPGQERHLPHEAWHIVQQRQGRVRPTRQLGGRPLNDDPGLEREADAMGSKALQMKGHDTAPLALTARAPAPAGTVQAWADEDILISRLRGLDTVIHVHGDRPNDLVLAELEELTDEISTKDWVNAAGVMVALRDKYGIDDFPPPLVSRVVTGGERLLNTAGVLPLTAPLEDKPPSSPGSEMIELGAGDMASAAALGPRSRYTAFTEFRSEDDTRKEYGDRLDDNLRAFGEEQDNASNTIKFGIDATQQGPYKDLPLTETLRFTNPNIGHDDIQARVQALIMAPLEDDDPDLLYISSMGLGFWLDGAQLNKNKEKPPKHGWAFAMISSTTNAIASVRNVYMLQQFLVNGPAKLIPGSGKIEIIVSSSYLDRWPICDIAHRMGYGCKVTENYDLGFENVKTQKSQAVKAGKQAEKSLITLYVPWGGSLLKPDVSSWVGQFTSLKSSLLIRVSGPH